MEKRPHHLIPKKCLLSAMLTLAFMVQAQAVREYMYRSLPDLGFGGEARQMSINPLTGQIAICGYARTSSGSIVSYEWDFDYNGLH